MDTVAPGDFQGRSLVLGSPSVVRIPGQIQPDLVLAVPPMHVDWIAPNNTALLNQAMHDPTTGCSGLKTPCVVNLSVKPSIPPSQSANPFATKFDFSSTANSSSKRASTTSWGVSVSSTLASSVTVGDAIDSGTISIKDTAKYMHDNTVKNTYDNYKGQTNQLTATTGFADHIFYTQRDLNVYYYPVLGAVGCSTDNPNCSDNQKTPLYVQFSVPDNVSHSDIDGTSEDWYQPAHEPGNILSYPWTLAQLESQFSDAVTPLTTSPQCMATDTSTQTTSTQWNQGSSQTNSSGSTNAFSDELSMSTSFKGGIEGALSASGSLSVDVGGSTSLNTLNESLTSLSSSTGITFTKPTFGAVATCCDYAFGQYIFGLRNKSHAPSDSACQSGETPAQNGCIAVNAPEGTPVSIASTGPLFTAYLADPLSGSNSTLRCAGFSPWWKGEYTKPDIALNHPERWTWAKASQTISFNTALPSSAEDPVNQQFYAMKGFFISKQGETSGPNLSEATAGDQLSLTARVYNYSLVDTTAPVHVRIYGQPYCSSGDKSEASCINANNVCQAGTSCGNSFFIGESQIPSIAGFESDIDGDPANWKTTAVDFDTTKYGGMNMLFWVVAWMEDSNGNLVAEMPGHGLSANPASAKIQQITDEPIEKYSNNIGMYGVHQQFYISPATTAPGAPESSGTLQAISLAVSGQTSLEQRTQITASLQAGNAPVNHVTIAYYDGDPTANGTLLDVQQIATMNAGANTYHRTFFTPEVCGAHTLHVSAWTSNTPGVTASAMTNVTIQPQDYVQALISSTQAITISDAQLKSSLIALLNMALQSFQQGNTTMAEAALSTYMQQLAAAAIDENTAGTLAAQANVLLGCGARGFSLTALPSSASVSAGLQASYDMALTPTGGFTGPVALSCSGLPAGASCSFPAQPIALDGQNQSQLSLTIKTNAGSPAVAGLAGPTPNRLGMRTWTMVLLINVLMIALLQRARRRHVLWSLVFMLVTLGGTIGCGGGGSTGGNAGAVTQPGTYTFTVKATSGSTVQTTTLQLVVLRLPY